ncbi:hypothetical protein EBI_26653 [Enterocytozoon bieneusi H348]|nr:hypothetical protein EBI_26653 [Enterocytozoon bieneusi H348]|eukprot:XP_002650759.1 hypothetical protein EBI_26653 [Enterocytozoon bieneusi H348]
MKPSCFSGGAAEQWRPLSLGSFSRDDGFSSGKQHRTFVLQDLREFIKSPVLAQPPRPAISKHSVNPIPSSFPYFKHIDLP